MVCVKNLFDLSFSLTNELIFSRVSSTSKILLSLCWLYYALLISVSQGPLKSLLACSPCLLSWLFFLGPLVPRVPCLVLSSVKCLLGILGIVESCFSVPLRLQDDK